MKSFYHPTRTISNCPDRVFVPFLGCFYSSGLLFSLNKPIFVAMFAPACSLLPPPAYGVVFLRSRCDGTVLSCAECFINVFIYFKNFNFIKCDNHERNSCLSCVSSVITVTRLQTRWPWNWCLIPDRDQDFFFLILYSPIHLYGVVCLVKQRDNFMWLH
jgi:hypothetical protein